MHVKALLFLALGVALTACAPQNGPITSSISSDPESPQQFHAPNPPAQNNVIPQDSTPPPATSQPPKTATPASSTLPETKTPQAATPNTRTSVTYTPEAPATPLAPRKTVTVDFTPAPHPSPEAARAAQTYEQELLELINASRAQGHLQPLTLNVTQSTGTNRCVGSYGHSVHMQQMKAISHDQFPQDICLPAGAWAENVGMSTGSEDFGIRSIHKGMMDEGPGGGHYQNIMNPNYNAVGIGIVYTGGAVWITENFLEIVQ